MSQESIETLIPELVHEEDWRRMRATAACLKGGPRAVHGLVQVLESGEPALKIEAAGMLARIKDPSAGVPLVRLLAAGDAGIRKAGSLALEQLAGVLDTAAVTALIEALAARQDEDHRATIARLLGLIPSAVEPLCGMLKHPQADARETAALILEQVLEPRSADALVDAMSDPSVQEIVVRTLKKLGAIRERIADTFNALRDVEGSVEREDARMAAVIALLGVGRPSVEILIEYLDDDDWVVREAAADLLGKIGDVRAVEPLMKRLQSDKDTGVKELALKSLGLIGDARPVQLYLEAIPIRPLRVFAMEALAKIKDVTVLAPYHDLFDRLKTDRDGLVAYNAGMIVDKLEAAAMQADVRPAAAGEEQHG